MVNDKRETLIVVALREYHFLNLKSIIKNFITPELANYIFLTSCLNRLFLNASEYFFPLNPFYTVHVPFRSPKTSTLGILWISEYHRLKRNIPSIFKSTNCATEQQKSQYGNSCLLREARFEVLTALLMENEVFWHVKSCRLVYCYW
jgi:hypothetical protein